MTSTMRSSLRAAGGISALLVTASVPWSGPAFAGQTDREAAELAAASPVAVELVAGAETAARAGHAKQAWDLFGRAAALARRSPLPWRGICRLSLALGIETPAQRAAAIDSCRNAEMLGGTPEDMRNRASSLVTGNIRPSMDDLVNASLAADGALRTGVGQPWGYGAWIDVAARLGDRELLEASLAEAQRLAPDDAETRRLLARWSARTPLPLRVAWGTLVLALVLTVADAAVGYGRRRRRRFHRLAVAVVALFSCIAMGGRVAAAPPEGGNRDPIALADLLLELPAKAEAASHRGDHADAARIWEEVAQAVPERAYGFARLCESWAAAGKREQALAACRTALTREGTTAADYTLFVKVLLQTSGPLSSSDRRQIALALSQLDTEPRAAVIAARARCDVAAHDHDRAGLAACTARLEAVAPEDWRTAAFAVALARETGDGAKAARALERARAAGAPADVLVRLAPASRSSDIFRRSGRVARALVWALGGVLAFALCLAATARRRSVARWIRERVA